MNNFSNAELHDLIPLHALGALEPDEVLLLEAYLVLNPEAQANYVWYLEAVAVLARSVPLLEPAQGLKARMLDRVRQVNAGPVCLARVDPGSRALREHLWFSRETANGGRTIGGGGCGCN